MAEKTDLEKRLEAVKNLRTIGQVGNVLGMIGSILGSTAKELLPAVAGIDNGKEDEFTAAIHHLEGQVSAARKRQAVVVDAEIMEETPSKPSIEEKMEEVTAAQAPKAPRLPAPYHPKSETQKASKSDTL